MYSIRQKKIYKNNWWTLLTAITKDAVSASASEKSSDEKEKLAAQLNQFIEQLHDAPEAQGLKNYFQLLLAAVNGEDYKPYLEKVPEELKELFEKTGAGENEMMNDEWWMMTDEFSIHRGALVAQ